MFKSTYSKDEVQEIINQEIYNVKNELIQYIDSLHQKNILLEKTIEQMKMDYENNLNDKINLIQSDINSMSIRIEDSDNKINNNITDLIDIKKNFNDKLENNLAKIKKIDNKINSNITDLIDIEKIFNDKLENNSTKIKNDFNIEFKYLIEKTKDELTDLIEKIIIPMNRF